MQWWGAASVFPPDFCVAGIVCTSACLDLPGFFASHLPHSCTSGSWWAWFNWDSQPRQVSGDKTRLYQATLHLVSQRFQTVTSEEETIRQRDSKYTCSKWEHGINVFYLLIINQVYVSKWIWHNQPACHAGFLVATFADSPYEVSDVQFLSRWGVAKDVANLAKCLRDLQPEMSGT